VNLKFACVSTALLLACASASGQQSGRIRYEGSELFRFALHEKKLKEVIDPKEVVSPSDTIIILTGDTSRAPAPLASGFWLEDFIKQGGAVLIASDNSNQFNLQAGGPTWGTTFGITLSGEHLTSEKHNCYRGIEGRPFVRRRNRVWPNASPFDIFAGIENQGDNALATDHPSEMIFQPKPGYRSSNLAGYAARTWRIDGPFAIDPRQNHFAVALEPVGFNSVGPGRLLVLADHSVFINGMMGFRDDPDSDDGFKFDNANWQFTNNTIDWLKAGSHKPRSRCLLIEDGRIAEKFAIELPPPPKPPIPNIPPEVLANWLLNHSNQIIDEAQERNIFNRVLENWLGLPRLLRWFLIATTIVFLIHALRWLRRGYRKAEPSSTLTPGTQSRFLPRGGVLRQRTAAQIEVGNLFEAANRRVRSRFDVLGGKPAPNGKMPPVLLASDLRDAPVLQHSIGRLWLIGYGDEPMAVPLGEWDRLNAMLERVSRRAARGDWSFGQDVA